MDTIIKAIKGNKSYTVNTEQEKNAYKAQGFDIYENGKLIENGVGKTVTLEDFNAIEAENDTLKAENAALKKENGKLEKENKKLKGDNSNAKEE